MDVESDEDVPLATMAKRNASIDEDSAEVECMSGSGNSSEKDSIENFKESLILPHCVQEYEWPQNKSGEYHVILNDFLEFLEVNIDDERLKGLEQREAEQDEHDHVKKLGIVDSKDDVKAIKIEDAFQCMAEYFPEKFNTYIKLSHQNEMRKLVRKQESQRVNVLMGKIPNIMKRRLKETVRYNSRLNQERMEERQAYFDLQTQIIHVPQKKRKYNPNNKPIRSKYPVALMPGQFQEYYKRYSSEELKRLPLRTVTEKWHCAKKAKSSQKPAVEEEATGEVDNESVNTEADTEKETEGDAVSNETKADKDPFCGICMKGPEMNKRGLPEKLIHCSQCENSGHPSCLDMNRNLVQVIQTYTWQCMECKICTECLAPHDEESMMFCDNCDRGYHSYCVGLKEIPKGRWVCDRCGKCSSCLVTNPVPDGGNGRWKNEFTKPLDGSEPEFLQSHCHPCSKLFRKGSFCPVCLKVYRESEDHVNQMVCCDMCDRWVHTDCDGIDEHRYQELSKDQRTSYTCILCRGEKEERMETFHRKNR